MLSDLLQVDKRIFEALANGRHSTQGRSLELLALKQALSIFDETDVVAGYGFDEGFRGVQLA